MGTYTFNLPDIGEGITEAEIVAWYVKPGDWVDEDGRLADLMTDKATVEMESPVAGRVLSIAGEVGDVIAIGSALVVLETEGEHAAMAEPAPAPVVSSPEAEPEPVVAKAPEAPPPPAVAQAPHAASEPAKATKVLASPAVRARARDLGIDLAQVKTAEDGRVRHADLDAFISYNSAFRAPGGARADEQVKVVGLRRRIAENMAASKRAIPHFTYVEECDVTDLEAMRAQLNSASADRPRLTMLPLLITALCRAMPHFPMINARYDDEAGVVTRHGAVHMGLATMTPAGLMVPVIRNAESLNLWQLAAEIARLAQAARDGKASSDELSGSTFTISSLGPLGGIASTPVINRPEVAIIAPNRIVERPMFVPDPAGGERVEKRKLMNLSISCDHRVVDGYDAAAFVTEVKRLIEAPALIIAG
jgi:2-oxoisovalerate dehydrogenase E2 component (dihydrolipoyl transacylase)